jgi:hypothetical protein
MHTYRKFAGHWIVGFARSSDWDNIKRFDAEWAAAKYVSYLNGGSEDGVDVALDHEMIEE